MKTNRRLLILAIVLGIVSVLVLNKYIKDLDDTEETVSIPYSQVVVATRTIPNHVEIREDMVELKSIPDEGIHPNAVTSIESILGGVTRSEIIAGEQVLAGRIVTEDIKPTLAYKIPQDMRAITLPVGEVSGVGGYIREGDRVDILVFYDDENINEVMTQYTQFQNIEVVEVGPSGSVEEGEVGVTSSLTILVSPEQAEVVAYANNLGSIHISLRNPMDTGIVNLTFYNATNFATYDER